MRRDVIDAIKAVSITLSVASLFTVVPVFADADFNARNDIYFYKSDDSGACGNVTTFNGSFPEETITKLEAANISDKAKENKARYDHAEQVTGVPWQIIAAIHFREANMDPTKSIADGSPLTAGVSRDGIPISSNPNEDAANLAGHFLSMAEGVYGLNKTALGSWSFDNWADALLAYNRGGMYKAAGEPYTKSPYVMNYFDEDHQNMPWIRADSYSGQKRLNGLFDSGGSDSRPGAMAVAFYLGLDITSSGSQSATNCGGSGGIYGDIVQTAIQLSWPDRNHNKNDPKPEYINAMSEVGLTNSGCGPSGADCGVFVAATMRASGADPDFPIGTSIIKKYLEDNTSKYTKVEATSTSDLMPGDIFIIPGHTMMYVGDHATDGGMSMASASCSDRTGDRGADIYFSDRRGDYDIYRKI